MTWTRVFEHGGEPLRVTCRPLDGNRYEILLGAARHEVRASRLPDGRVAFDLDGQTWLAAAARIAGGVHVRVGGRTWTLPVHEGRRGGADAVASGEIAAPMTGTVLDVAVAPGQRVAAGDLVAVVTAMKMEHRLLAQIDGEVVEVAVAPGQSVAEGARIARIEP